MSEHADDFIEISDPERLVASPKVSILMLTYNHEDYLPDAIDGVIAQCCDFGFELIIGEDASSDKTLSIALAYQARFPEKVRVIRSKFNVGMNANGKRIFSLARGDYVSFCEGDDFWCASDKLARQVELIEKDERVGIVHSDWTKAKMSNGHWVHNMRKSVHRRVASKRLEGDLFPTWHFPKILRTCTVLLRRETVRDFENSTLSKAQYRFGDSVLNAYVTSRYRVAYLPKVAAVYRVSPNSALRSGVRARVAFYRSALQFDTDARAFFSGERDYRPDYRWESAASLLVWGLRACDLGAVKDAIFDFAENFTFLGFLRVGLRTCAMRIPTLRRQAREVPGTVRT
ncbi:glycosyltransferase family 2 protein [Dyella lutea]|uniref:Glycosyltransferase family 2 protein n=1 Tax=Dyella lutea TaxID=2950441 RepID=A0ABT1F9L5_9GAMM|nr:glycosyltransferase family 2 protein [Dyella lutea]MCP1374076.1 glycosyltransferase family 2 protein [Dyella lutea]